ncbi:MAG: hypothetical protein NTW87_11220 [Planctomycetota bacterium]|nr:hypothetical protein [Planctomycetota bacterium]
MLHDVEGVNEETQALRPEVAGTADGEMRAWGEGEDEDRTVVGSGECG